MIGVGPELVVWMMTTIASLEVALCEVDSIEASFGLAFGSIATMIEIISATLGASAVTIVGLETILLGLVCLAVVHLAIASSFYLAYFPTLSFQVASYLALLASL